MHVGKFRMAGAVRTLGLVVLVVIARPAFADDLIGPLQSDMILYEGTMQAIENDGGLCPGLVKELAVKIDRSANRSEKATLRDYLNTAQKCAAKTRQVVRDGAAIHGRCSDVLEALQAVDDAPSGSNAARRAGAIRKAAKGCIASFERWDKEVDALKALMDRAVEIIRAT